MKGLLDCSSYNSTIDSVANIYDVSTNELRNFLQNIEEIPRLEEPSNYLLVRSKDELSRNCIINRAVWFHGSRLLDPGLIYKKGILPKKEVEGEILSLLSELASDLEKKGKNPFSVSLSGKQGGYGEGPFAFLFRDVALYAPGAHHSYVEVPEIIEDFAGFLLGENYPQLVQRYKKISKPVIVSFYGEAGEFELMHALWYLYLVEQGIDSIQSSNIAITCFDNQGKKVEQEDIINIEEVNKFT